MLATKNEIATVQWKKPKSWNVIGDKFINYLSNSQICALIKTPCEFDNGNVKASVSSLHLLDRFRKTSLVCMNKSLKRERPLWKLGQGKKMSDISS